MWVRNPMADNAVSEATGLTLGRGIKNPDTGGGCIASGTSDLIAHSKTRIVGDNAMRRRLK